MIQQFSRRWLLLCLVLVVLCTFAAAAQEAPVVEQERPSRPLLSWIFGYGFIFQIAAIVHWARHGRDRFWIWVIIIGGVVGALAYFVVEALPDVQEMSRSFKGPGRRKQIAALRAMIRDNPSAGNFEQLGELLVQERKWSEAREAFDKALASRTDLLDTFYWRGVAAFELGDDPAAIRDLQHVVRTDPKYDYSRAQSLLARSLARAGDIAQASSIFEKLVQSSTAAESLVTAAEFFAEQGRHGEARELVEAVLARRATMPSFQKRRDRQWLRRAKKLDRKLRKAAADAQSVAA